MLSRTHRLTVGEGVVVVRCALEVRLLHHLRLVLVPHVLHLVLVSEQDGRHTVPVSLLFSLCAEGRCFLVLRVLSVVDEALRRESQARVHRLIHTRLVDAIIVLEGGASLDFHWRLILYRGWQLRLSTRLLDHIYLALEVDINRSEASVTV